jgi:hypothetical protein
LDNNEGEMFTHLTRFLQAILTGHNLGDKCPRLLQNDLFAPVPAQAKLWAKSCFVQIFPTLQPAPVPQAPQQPDMAALLAQVLAMTNPQNANAAPNDGEEKKDEDLASKLKMSTAEVGKILMMCGIENGDSEQLAPMDSKMCCKGHKQSIPKNNYL